MQSNASLGKAPVAPDHNRANSQEPSAKLNAQYQPEVLPIAVPLLAPASKAEHPPTTMPAPPSAPRPRWVASFLSQPDEPPQQQSEVLQAPMAPAVDQPTTRPSPPPLPAPRLRLPEPFQGKAPPEDAGDDGVSDDEEPEDEPTSSCSSSTSGGLMATEFAKAKLHHDCGLKR